MCSSHAFRGMSRPVHYDVLCDENGLELDQLQRLIFAMCFTFVNCPNPISLVPAIKNADIAAYRGMLYHEAAQDDVEKLSTSSLN
ncbi:protein argonaute 2 [Phtheirospermum japonicum]|uniref:Protein argonaute 2 n=1 Tax=Phtheirospermum japonicum TaxID=374723 RepID=A0A830DP79_9LAMI|nr:protein argonaute 2 [Phtheirospermum japonicum]